MKKPILLKSAKGLTKEEFKANVTETLRAKGLLKDKTDSKTWARHQMVALLDWALTSKVCLDIACTTCGNTDFRRGLALFAHGCSPDNAEAWEEQIKGFDKNVYAKYPLGRGNKEKWLQEKLLGALEEAPWGDVVEFVGESQWSEFRTLILESFSQGEMHERAEKVLPMV